MSILDRLFIGKVIKDFGPLEKRSFGVGGMTKSVLLVERQGRLVFVFKESVWFLISASIRYQTLSLDEAYKLRGLINESEQIARNLPPSTYNPAKDIQRNTFIIMVVALGLFSLAQDWVFALVVALSVLAVHIKQLRDAWHLPNINRRVKTTLALITILTLMAGISRIIWLVMMT